MAKNDLGALFSSAFRIRPGELGRVGLMFLYQFSIVAAFIIGRTARDTLFLHRVSVDALPLMYVAVAAAVSFSSYGYSRLADHHRIERLMTISLAIFITLVTAFWFLISFVSLDAWPYAILYVVVEIVGAICIIQFWTLANDIFSSRQAKRLFGFIGAGGVVASIGCGFAVGNIAPVVGPENLLLISALSLGAGLIALRGVIRLAKAELEHIRRKPKKTHIGIAKDSGTILHHRHLYTISAIVVLTFLVVTVVDFQFKAVARQTYKAETELAAYFGYFYGFTGVAGALVQIFLTARLLERASIAVSLSLLPMALTLGTFAIVFIPFIPAIVAVTMAKGAENILRYTVNDATMQILYVPVASHQRRRAKAFIDGILKPASIGLSGLLIFFASRVFPPDVLAINLAYLDVILLAGWIASVLRVRREYVKLLVKTLHSRRLDLDTPWSLIADEETTRLLKKRLLSTNESHTINALEILPSVDADFEQELRELLGSASEPIRIKVLNLIAAKQQFHAPEALTQLMSDSSPQIRAAAVRAYCSVKRLESVPKARPFLDDKSVLVRAAATTALIQHGGLDGILTAAEVLKSFLTSEDTSQRLQGAKILGEIKVRNFFQPVAQLLEDPNRQVRAAAAAAAGEMQSKELISILTNKLGDQAIGQAAARALANYSKDIEAPLIETLNDRQTSILVRRRIPWVLARIGGQASRDALTQSLRTADLELRLSTARSLNRLKERDPTIRLNQDALSEAIRTEVERAYQILATIEDLGLSETHIMREALSTRLDNLLRIAFRLYEARYTPRMIQIAYSNLKATNKSIRANAIELMDNVLSKEDSRLILPILEDHPRTEKIRFGEEFFTLKRNSVEGWLRSLLTDSHAWIVASSMYFIKERCLVALCEDVRRHIESKDPVIRETAYLTLASIITRSEELDTRDLGSPEDLRRIIHTASSEPTARLREAGGNLIEALSGSGPTRDLGLA